jgi:hypothetical protein
MRAAQEGGVKKTICIGTQKHEAGAFIQSTEPHIFNTTVQQVGVLSS